jgi:hypothetical protein
MSVTLVKVDDGQPFVESAELVNNQDGSVSFKLPNGHYAGQEPNVYGERNDNAEPKQYQRATLNGSSVTFLPVEGSLPCVYLLGAGTVYPA